MIKTKLKKLSGILLLGITSLCMSGCSVKIDVVSAELVKAIEERAQTNISVIEDLANTGFITEQEKTEWIKSITDLTAKYTNTAGMEPKDLTTLTNAMAYIDESPTASEKYDLFEEKKDGEGHTYRVLNGILEDDWDDTYLPAVLKTVNKGKYWTTVGVHSGTITSLPMVTTNMQDIINQRLSLPIYVLKSQADIENSENNLGLDGIVEQIAQATADPNKINDKILANYFQNSNQTLLDLGGNSLSVISETTSNTSSSANQLGKDLVIRQCGFDALSVRLTEFNPDTLDVLKKVVGSGSSKFIFSNGKLYLMEYPVYILNQIKRVDDSSYNTIVGPSSIHLSLKTKELYRRMSDGTYKQIDSSDAYWTFGGAASNTDASLSSFVLWGSSTKLDISFDFKAGSGLSNYNKMEEVPGGYARIVLRDYLEGSYAPGLVSNENVVAFGRRVRVAGFANTDEGDASGRPMDQAFAYYINRDGSKNENLPDLFIDDIADATGLGFYGNEPRVYYIQRGNVNKDADGMTPLDASELEDGLKTSLQAVNQLTWEAKDTITPYIKFPGTSIATVDNFYDSKPQFYVIPVVKGFFESALYSDWLSSSDQTASLTWWNNWLTSHNFAYQINSSALEELLLGNYQFELNQQGVVILDLETIAKIQEDYEEIDQAEKTKSIRTLFVVLGWLLIALSIIFLLAWTLDTNVDFGVNILEKLTFGHWIAIKYEDEMPYTDLQGRSYITLKALSIKILVMIFVGLVLIFVPVTNIAVKFIEIFGGFADIVSNLLSGI